MGILFRKSSPAPTAHVNYRVMDPPLPISATTMPQRIYATQPSVRKVVEFIARNVSRVQLKAFRGTEHGSRQLLTEGPLVDLITSPSPNIGIYRFLHDLVCDLMIYDRFLVCYMPESNSMERIAVARWNFHQKPNTIEDVDGFTSSTIDARGFVPFDDSTELGWYWDRGYGDYNGISPMETLQQTLQEYTESVAWRRNLWKNGIHINGYWSQDMSEQPLSADARSALEADLGRYRQGGGKEGAEPVTRGLEYHSLGNGFTPKDAQEVENRTLSDIEVASAYQVPPEMVGAREGKYATQQAFRDALYRETLGPIFAQLTSAFNQQISRIFFPGQFVEFDLESALRGSFLDDAVVTSKAVGGPWLSVNEARAEHGYESLGDEFDGILTYLNTVRGGGTEADPTDSGEQNIGGNA